MEEIFTIQSFKQFMNSSLPDLQNNITDFINHLQNNLPINMENILQQFDLSDLLNIRDEQDVIKLKFKLFIKEIDRAIKNGKSKNKIGWHLTSDFNNTFNKKDLNVEVIDIDQNTINNLNDLNNLKEDNNLENNNLENKEELNKENEFLIYPNINNYIDINFTNYFEQHYPMVEDCNKYKGILFIGGLFTSYYPLYFTGLQKYLNLCGMNYKISNVNTGKSVKTNMEYLRSEIINYFNELNNNTKITIIAHSKGVIDLIHSISKYREDLEPIINGIISLQAPYSGSALANDIAEFGAENISILRFIVHDLLGGELQAIKDLSYDHRKELLKEYPFPYWDISNVVMEPENVKQLTGPQRCISIVSYDNNPLSLLYPAISYLKVRYNVLNDGLVPTIDGIIPGCKNIVIKEMDHSGGAFTGFPNISKYDPERLVLTLLYLLNQYL
ncbi:hypothetical protein ABK040_015574 [Willaertia magna]